MKSLVISYELKGLNQYQKVLFNRKLFGFKDNSNKCQYSYEREGVIKRADYIKLGKGAIAIKQQDKPKILKLFNQYHIKPTIIPALISQYHFTYY